MRKYLFIPIVLLTLSACDSSTDCNKTTAAKHLLYINGEYNDMRNPRVIKHFESFFEAVKDTGYKSPKYGTPICKVKDSQTGKVFCYSYVPKTKGYAYEDLTAPGCDMAYGSW